MPQARAEPHATPLMIVATWSTVPTTMPVDQTGVVKSTLTAGLMEIAIRGKTARAGRSVKTKLSVVDVHGSASSSKVASWAQCTKDKDMHLRLLIIIMLFGCTPSETTQSSVKGSTINETTPPTPLTPKPHSAIANHIIKLDTVYYLTGPQQGRPPEGEFKAGTPCIVIQKNGAYTLIKSVDGKVAWISSDALQATPK